IALGVFSIYEDTYGYSLNEDLLTNAILLHDNLKPWVLQWNSENRCLPEINIAGTGCHHVQEIADVMYRGLDPDLVITLADSHEHPGWKSQEDQVVGWIKAAAIIAGKDPIKEGYLDKSGETLPLPRRPEGFLVHLGDHDFVLTAPVSRWLNAEIEKMAVKEYGIAESELKSKKYNTLRNYIYSQASDMHLYQTWVDKGDKALWDAVLDVVVPD
ncbi:MAG: TAT (twin-arginine translocation) pathway signal sequence, partial [Anaerovibrio sp.]|nr:TAT (twin-arginine translocation) pathway signal sequence [Anaerovibrio sp.]